MFGIDFGTTNTRIAFFDGRRPVMVPVRTPRGAISYHIPSVVGYQDGKAVCFGHEALTDANVIRQTSLKWLDRPVPVGNGEMRPPVEVLADFLSYLRDVVSRSNLLTRSLDKACLSVPVRYPYQARRMLLEAMEEAGIEVAAVYHEPVSALYCHLKVSQTPGFAAVFDWGGGTLDTAVVRVEDHWARVLDIGGLQCGGETFDRYILDKALADFMRRNPEIDFPADRILNDPRRGPELRLLAEQAKKLLSTEREASMSRLNLVGRLTLAYRVHADEFGKWISPDVGRAMACLDSTIGASDIPGELLGCLLLSGGTSNIPLVRNTVLGRFDPGIVAEALHGLGGSAELKDVANATAIGSAMLGALDARPVFARDIGIRVANDVGEDAFLPVFRRGEPVPVDIPQEVPLFVTNASTGVARLMICDRLSETDARGRLLRILPVPIDRQETWVRARFAIGRHLVLEVSATGNIRRASDGEGSCQVTNLAVGFELPHVAEQRMSGQNR